MYYIDLYDSTEKSKGYNVSIGGNTPRFKRKTLSISELVDLYINKQFPLAKIAEKFGVSRYIITTELINAGVSIRDRHVSAEKVSKIDTGLIKEAIANTTSLRAAAKYARIKYSTFRQACINNHIEYNSSKSARQ